jgi:hypothetical protein
MEAREISLTIKELSEESKKELRRKIQEQFKVNNFLGKPFHRDTLLYTLDILDGKEPIPMRRRPAIHRNGKVILIKKGGK